MFNESKYKYYHLKKLHAGMLKVTSPQEGLKIGHIKIKIGASLSNTLTSPMRTALVDPTTHSHIVMKLSYDVYLCVWGVGQYIIAPSPM